MLDQFNNFLGPELRAVTGEGAGIDQIVNRVDSLIDPLEHVPFDIFDRRYSTALSCEGNISVTYPYRCLPLLGTKILGLQ